MKHACKGLASCLPVLALVLLAASDPVAAQQFPSKEITFIVPWGAGGGADATARMLAPGMERALGAKVQVVNKPGAGSAIGLGETARSAPTGYTIALINLPTGMTVYLDPATPALFGRKDLAGVALVNNDPTVLLVKADSPYKTLADLVKAAKASPGTITTSITGQFGANHLVNMLLMQKAGISLRVVNFAGGTAETLPAVLGGHVAVGSGVIGSWATLHVGGQIRILAIADSERSPFLPDVPTFKELGYDIFIGESRGIVVPAATPADVIVKLASGVEAALGDANLKEKMAKVYMAPGYAAPQAFSKYWDEMEATIKPIIDAERKGQK
jgi:tripartite-type tricarboxylate transporter receptor subunit TctC